MNRAQRRHRRRSVINKRLKELKQVDRYCYNTIKKGSLSKQDAFDCGNTKCCLCHFEKLFSSVNNKGYKKRNNIYKEDLLDE